MRTQNPNGFLGFLKKFRVQILLVLLLSLLTVMSYAILGKAAADSLLLPEWATRYLLLPIALASVVLTVLRRYCASLCLFAGYHAGIVLAIVGTGTGAEQLPYAQTVLFSVLLIAIAVGVWGEVLPTLLRRWRKDADTQV